MIISSELFDDLLSKRRVISRVFTSSLADGSKIFPVDGVVDVSSKIELDSLAQSCHFVVVEVLLGFWVSEEVPSNWSRAALRLLT